MADDQLEQWLISGEKKQERRSRIVPSSAERLGSEDPGDGEAAMDAVAAWTSTQPDMPLIEMAHITPRAIIVSLVEPAVLPEPWVSSAEDQDAAHEEWGITIQHAMNLPRGERYGRQVAGLTGIGWLHDGRRMLLNTCRWQLLGVAGTPEWTRSLMVTQVMSHAAEPWCAEHEIWLIGFGDTAEKLRSFVTRMHPPHRFHFADSLAEVSASDLEGSTATFYVLGSDGQTLTQFKALHFPGVGMITDQIVTDQAMWLSERDEGAAALGPFERELELWPNLRRDLVEKMEAAWEVNEEVARQQAAAADFSAFFEEEQKKAQAEGAEQKTTEQIRAEFEAITAGLPLTEDESSEDEQAAEPTETEAQQETPEVEAAEPAAEPEAADITPEVSPDDEGDETEMEEAASEPEPEPEPEPEATEEQQEAPSEAEEEPAAEEASEDVPNASSASDAPTGSDAPTQEEEQSDELRLRLLGDARAHTPAGELTGRHAAALVMLEMTNEPLTPQQISEALWPGDDAAGHTARTRRSRLLSKLREHVGEIITTGEDGWSIAPGSFTTDYDQVLTALKADPATEEQAITAACERIARPLEGAEAWADYYRDRMTEALTAALTDLKARAVEADAFDVAKAAKTAGTTLGED